MWSTATTPGPLVIRPGIDALRHAALAAAMLAGTAAVLSHGGIRPRSSLGWSPPGSGDLDLISIGLAVASTLPLIAWRRSPLGTFAVAGAASALLAGLSYPLDVALAPAAALYLLAAHRPRTTPWTARITLTVAVLFVAYLAAATAAQRSFPQAELLHSGLAWAVAWFAGERTRLRRLHIADLHERARRAEREADRERQLAAAEERARIARDLHDSAGHAISVIAVRAGAARLRHHQDPNRSLHALEAIEELARTTADEIDHIVASLRDDGRPESDIDPPPGLASLETLIARHASAGLDVEAETSGAPRALGGAADQAAYRILQEALTNAARHGTGRARIQIAYGDTAIRLTITNPTPAARAPRPSGGHGLIGMRERATLLGGDHEASQANGTFRVHARLPYRASGGGHA